MERRCVGKGAFGGEPLLKYGCRQCILLNNWDRLQKIPYFISLGAMVLNREDLFSKGNEVV